VVFYNFQASAIPIIFRKFSQEIFKFWDFQKTIQFPIIFSIKVIYKKFLKTQKLKFHEEKKKRQTCLGSKFFDSENEELLF
jgi:hypothetical protein